jgi:hypothetical protein
MAGHSSLPFVHRVILQTVHRVILQTVHRVISQPVHRVILQPVHRGDGRPLVSSVVCARAQPQKRWLYRVRSWRAPSAAGQCQVRLID